MVQEQNHNKTDSTTNHVNHSKENSEKPPEKGDSLDGQLDSTTQFEPLLEAAGDSHWYQNRLLWYVLVPLDITLALVILQQIFILTVPDHWCHLPGRTLTNLTLDQWKEITLPKEIGPDGQLRFSHCKMRSFDVDFEEIARQEAAAGPAVNNALNDDLWLQGFKTVMNAAVAASRSGNSGAEGIENVKCKYGWEFDQTYYWNTIPSTYEWVCDKAIYSTNAFTLGSIGSFFGNILLGAIADRFGRKPISLLAVASTTLARLLGVATASVYVLYLLACNLASIGVSQSFTAPFTIVTEVSGQTFRTRMYGYSFQAWVLGMCLTTFTAWLLADWLWISLIGSLPNILIFYFCYKYLPESPRWLLTRGHVDQTELLLRDIAKVNKREEHIPADLSNQLKILSTKREESIGFRRIAQSKHLLIRITLMSISWTANSLIYRCLHLNLQNMSGNPFLNFFYLAVVEVPGNYLGQVCCDKFGRRMAYSSFMFLCFVFLAVNAGIVIEPSLTWLVIVVAVAAKFAVTGSFFTAFLHASELFPTCIRQTGLAILFTVGNIFDIAVPYISFLGTIHLALPYAIMALVALFGSISAFCLPETKGELLPETMEDAENFGKKQSWFPDWTNCLNRRGKCNDDVIKVEENANDPIKEKERNIPL